MLEGSYITLDINGSAVRFKLVADDATVPVTLQAGASLEPQGKKAKKAKKAKKPEDPNRPKRPVAGFMRYLQENRDAFKAELLDATPGVYEGKAGQLNAAISTLGGKRWNALDADAKEVHNAAYRCAKLVYDQAMKTYNENQPPTV